MECNKDEAIRAREIAEKKMQSNDFGGARRIALKAQELFPELENITQLLAVCNVHCSAESTILGSEKDWYSILQVERLADEVTIKKQYRKLALVLHPDKNKFPGAEAAFKLIGEAHIVLSDRGKRSLFDRKIGISLKCAQAKPPSRQVNTNPSARKQSGVQNNTANGFSTQFSGLNHLQKTQATSTTGQKSFWTCCPYCNVKYLYQTDYVNKVLRCQKCTKPYVAYDIAAQGVFPGTNENQDAAQGVFPGTNQSRAAAQGVFRGSSQNDAGAQVVFPGSNQSQAATQSVPRPSNWSQPGVSKPKNGPIQETYRTGEHRSTGSAAYNLGSQGNTSSRAVDSFPGETRSSAKGGLGNRTNDNANSTSGVNEGAAMPKEDVPKAGGAADVRKKNRKRGRKQEPESSESCDTSSSSDVVDITLEESVSNPAGGQSSGFNAFHVPRRSSRQKHQVSYNEGGSDDDDFESPPKKSREVKSFFNGGGLQQGIVNDTPNFANPTKHKEDVPVNGGSLTGDAEVCENQATGRAAGASDGGAEKVEIIDDSESDDGLCPEFLHCPDPEFNDFDKGKEEGCFAVGQFWACYDEVDGMPRFYTRIRKVQSPGFKLHINWLEPDPDDREQIVWAAQKLPVGCGKFRLGRSKVLPNCQTISHQVLCDKGMDKGSFMVYPRKEEIWALFKDWDIKWSTDPGNHKRYKYEIVQVVSDFMEGDGIRVAFLEKVRGFVSLFQQRSHNGAESLLVPPNEIFKFSHRIPFFKMSGTEKEGVPEGSFELDPACLPPNPDDICYPLKVEVDDKNMDAEANSSDQESSKINESKLFESEITPKKSIDFVRKSGFVGETCKVRRSPRGLKITEKENKHSGSNVSIQKETAICMNGKGDKNHREFSPSQTDVSTSKPSKKLDVKMQESTPSKTNGIHQSSSTGSKVLECFHDFKEDRCEEKFKEGQIWALYMPEHNSPKMYGQIMKIEGSPFKLHVALLEPDTRPKNGIQPACGTFKVKTGKLETFEPCSFSHLLKVSFVHKGRVEIYPNLGEVWALYGNRNSELVSSELENRKCQVVEITELTNGCTKVSPLIPLKGHKSVFRSPRRQRSGVETIDIQKNEFARFSHQIPAFKADKGTLADWVLDPASVPRNLVSGK